MRTIKLFLLALTLCQTPLVCLAGSNPKNAAERTMQERPPLPLNDCIKDCASDTNPCDPWYFKKTDGRCGNG